MDYFGDRYKDKFQWTSPDQPFVDNNLSNPQKWNLYSYVSNNPINSLDNDGRIEVRLWSETPTWQAGTQCMVQVKFNTLVNDVNDALEKLGGTVGRVGKAQEAANQFIGEPVKRNFDNALNNAQVDESIKNDFREASGAWYETASQGFESAIQEKMPGEGGSSYTETEMITDLQNAINSSIDDLAQKVSKKHPQMGIRFPQSKEKEIKEVVKVLKKEFNVKNILKEVQDTYNGIKPKEETKSK